MEIYNKKNKCSETDILYLKLNENGNRAYSYKISEKNGILKMQIWVT